MAGIQELLERLVTDRKFRAALEKDPKAALAGYELSDDDREMLAAQLSTDAGTAGTVEQRTSKSALLAPLGALTEGWGEGAIDEVEIGGLADDPDRPVISGAVHNPDGSDAPEITTDESSEDGVERWQFTNAWPSKAPEEGVADLAGAGEESKPFKIELKDALVTSYETGADADPSDLAAPGPEDEPAVNAYLQLAGPEGEAQADTGAVADPGSEPSPANQTDYEFVSRRAEDPGSATPDPAPDSSDDFATPEREPKEALLLPAVQKVRAAAGSEAGEGVEGMATPEVSEESDAVGELTDHPADADAGPTPTYPGVYVEEVPSGGSGDPDQSVISGAVHDPDGSDARGQAAATGGTMEQDGAAGEGPGGLAPPEAPGASDEDGDFSDWIEIED